MLHTITVGGLLIILGLTFVITLGLIVLLGLGVGLFLAFTKG